MRTAQRTTALAMVMALVASVVMASTAPDAAAACDPLEEFANSPAERTKRPVQKGLRGPVQIIDDGGPAAYIPCDDPPPPPPPPSGPPTYSHADPKLLTIGDSFASGTGIWAEDSSYDQQYGGAPYPGYKLTARSDNECWREKESTPGPQIAADTGRHSIFLACKGAEATHVGRQFDLADVQWPAEAATEWDDAVILVTMGGNDLRTNRGETWPELIERCITEILPFWWGCEDNGKNQIANFQQVQNSVAAELTDIVSRAENAQIRLVGYPMLFTPQSPIWNCWAVTGLSYSEATWADGNVGALNSRLQSAVNSVAAANPGVDIAFVDTVPGATNGACTTPASQRHVNDRVTAWSGSGVLFTSDASFHPTLLGYQSFESAIAASL